MQFLKSDIDLLAYETNNIYRRKKGVSLVYSYVFKFDRETGHSAYVNQSQICLWN